MKEIIDIVRDLKKEGAQVINNLVAKQVSTKEFQNYDRVTLTLNKDIPQFVADNNGAFVEGSSRFVFASSYSIGAVLTENEETAYIKNYVIANPRLLEIILSWATVDVVLERVTEGEDYINPFSSKTTPTPVNHDQYYVHIININLSETGLETVREIKRELIKDELAIAKAKRGTRRRTTTRIVETTEEVVDEANEAEDTTEEVVDAPATETTSRRRNRS